MNVLIRINTEEALSPEDIRELARQSDEKGITIEDHASALLRAAIQAEHAALKQPAKKSAKKVKAA